MSRHMSCYLYLLAIAALPVTGYPQALANNSGPTAAALIRQLPISSEILVPKATKLISGTIHEKGSGPLEGVLVTTKDGHIVSGSMQDGQYYIEIPVRDSILIFSLDGFKT